SGRVVDGGSQRALADVQIVVAGATASVRTGEDGRYRLTIVTPGAITLRAVRLGYGAESRVLTVAAGATTTADFALSPVAITLDQMMVTATGETERRRESGISIGTIDTSQLNPASVANLSTVLAARTPGVSVLSSTGSTGMGSRIRIRGSNSINLSNDPLLIVDGVRVNNQTASLAFSLAGQTTSRFDDLNPEDIETIEIIKGPAASALYGTAAASGVIQVTTKRGRAGRTRWNSFGEYGTLNDVTRYPDNWSQIGRLVAAPTVRVSRCVTENVVLGACTAVPDSMYRYQPLENPDATPFRQGYRGVYGMNAAGGADVATYYLSGSVEREQGVYDPNDLVRADIRANVRAELAPNLDASITTGYMSSRTGLTFNDNSAFGPIGAGLLGKAYDCNPSTWTSMPGCAAAGDSSSRGYFNANTPATALWAQQMESDADHFTSGMNTNWQPLPWLRALGQAGVDVVQQNDVRFVPPNVLPQLGPTFAQGFKYAQRRTLPTYSLQGTATATFQPRDGLQSATSFSGQYVREELHWISAYGQQILPGTESLSGASALFAVGESNQEIVTLGIFGQEKLAWRDRLFLTASLRGDQGSTFGADAGYIYYPAASLSWVVTDEPFMPHYAWLEQLRLRAAYGQSGQRPGFRQAQSFFASAPIRMSGAEQTGITLGGTGNADLRPERSTEWESGLESNFLGGRAGAELTYYHKTTTDALVRQILAPSLGATTDRFANLGRVRNSGLEARVNADVFRRGPASFSATLTYATNHNTLLALGADTLPILFGPQQYHTGYPLGAFFARKILSYRDLNGDGIISRVNCPAHGGVANPQIAGGPACEVVLSDSEQYLGSPLPTREGALTGALTLYQNLRISALLDYRGGFRQYNYTREFRCNGVGDCREVNDASAPLGDQANATASRMGTAAGYIEDASFVKLRELAVTLQAPRHLAARLRLDVLSLTLAGRNLHTWTRYSGFDPEVNSATVGTFGSFSQVDYLAQPPVRTLLTRVNLTF
ncbi:MAG TPA: SusC/RagA family TonB-linked outer membrane protein, partial [Gemmatimonadaceae bacterium]|nr:SusC/RagA family TonB-linked outer membrane protein [Gemmatimonadaceae bacterium]